MNQVQSSAWDSVDNRNGREFTLLDLAIVLAKNKRLVVGLPLIAAVASAAISFALPNVYQASTKLMPPQQAQSGAAALLSQLGGAAGLAAGMAGLKNPGDLYIGMLKSRTVADHLIGQYNLKQVYDLKLQEKARKELEENTSFGLGKDGIITIEVEDHDQKRAAQLANSYVDELGKLMRVLAVTEASQRRVFFEQQLERAKDNLAAAEIALKKGLDSRGVISVDVESRAIVETVGRLRAQISAKEIQLNSLRPFMTETNPEFRRVQEELGSLRKELTKLENGQDAESSVPQEDSSKRAGLENIKLLRDVKYYQMLYELLAKQYEVARLDEAKDPALVQVLDRAVEPERKHRPRRAMIIVLSTVCAFFLAMGLAFFKEKRNKMLQTPEGALQWDQLKKHLKNS